MRCTIADNECSSGRLRRGLCERHYRRLLHHGSTSSPWLELLSRYQEGDNGCHIWLGPIYPDTGYGKLSRAVNGTRTSHRAAYIEQHGTVPEGMDLDHLCHKAPCAGGRLCPHRRCINPDHLQPVPRRVNLLRGHASRIVCRNGIHDITVEGALIPGTYQCLQCVRAKNLRNGRRRTARNRAGLAT